MQMFLDGQRVNTYVATSVAELEAVEVYYSAAGTPAEFNNARAGCGTIVLWSRRPLYTKPVP